MRKKRFRAGEEAIGDVYDLVSMVEGRPDSLEAGQQIIQYFDTVRRQDVEPAWRPDRRLKSAAKTIIGAVLEFDDLGTRQAIAIVDDLQRPTNKPGQRNPYAYQRTLMGRLYGQLLLDADCICSPVRLPAPGERTEPHETIKPQLAAAMFGVYCRLMFSDSRDDEIMLGARVTEIVTGKMLKADG